MTVTKVILATQSATTEQLLDPALRDALRRAGASAVQVNAPDPAFDAAMRLDAMATPLSGTVAVWGPVPAEELLAAATSTGLSGPAWTVEETVPLPGPDLADGERTSAMANLAFLRRPAEMPYEEWRERWLGNHTQVAIDTQDTFGYVQNRVLEPLGSAVDGDGQDVAAVVEELFHEAAATDVHVFYGSGGDDAELNRRITELMASVATFGAADGLDLVPTARYRWNLGA